MKFEIKHWVSGKLLFECDADSMRLAVEMAVEKKANLYGANLYGANLDGANLTRANLDGANLTRANLDGANLIRANLTRANLDGANLTRANLYGANLDGANLTRANLYGANLDGANLTRANLDGANLDGANLTRANLDPSTKLDTGETFEVYLRDVLPALCAAGGRPIAEIITAQNWDCYSWDNCPMAEAFRVHSEEHVPPLLRPRVRQFIHLFDAKLIPLDKARAAAGLPA
jgi:hypothetical protein